jgi:hypothetical protein
MRKTWFVLLCGVCLSPLFADDSDRAFIAHLNNNKAVTSTVPANGDVNPYGVAIVPRSAGNLVANDILVGNFNNSKNLQGTGSTIVRIGPGGDLKLFAQITAASVPGCPGGVGLTTALVALRSGFVIVGSLPTSDGSSATIKPGCLIVLDSMGKVVQTMAGNGIDGPWDMTAADFGPFAVLFVSNVLNGTVLRILLAFDNGGMPREIVRTVIGSGFGERPDPNALIIGPTGLGLGREGTLYVADTLANRIAAIPAALFRLDSAGAGNTLSKGGGLNGPLGLAIAPNGDILTVNSGDGNMVDISTEGEQLAVKNVDATNTGAGTLFGLAIDPHGNGVYLVNDGNNVLYLLH